MNPEQEKNSKWVDLFRTFWPVAVVLISVVVNSVINWTTFGVRLDAIESRQDRQGSAITSLQTSVTDTQNNYAALNAKVDSLSDNVLYIRQRIDNALSK